MPRDFPLPAAREPDRPGDARIQRRWTGRRLTGLFTLRGRTFPVVVGLTLLSYAVNLFLFVMGRYRDAVEQYRLIVSIDPANTTAKSNLGAALMLAAEFEESRQVLEETLRRLKGRHRCGVLVGDVATERDAERIRTTGRVPRTTARGARRRRSGARTVTARRATASPRRTSTTPVASNRSTGNWMPPWAWRSVSGLVRWQPRSTGWKVTTAPASPPPTWVVRPT